MEGKIQSPVVFTDKFAYIPEMISYLNKHIKNILLSHSQIHQTTKDCNFKIFKCIYLLDI